MSKRKNNIFFGGSFKKNQYNQFVNKDGNFRDTEDVFKDDSTVSNAEEKSSENSKKNKKRKPRKKRSYQTEIIIGVIILIIGAGICFLCKEIWNLSIEQQVQANEVKEFRGDVNSLKSKNDELQKSIAENDKQASVLNEFKKNIEKDINYIKVKLQIP